MHWRQPAAPSNKTDDAPDVLRLTVYGQSGQSSSDKVYLLRHPDCSAAFDNGWDGRKMSNTEGLLSVSTTGEAGQLAVDTRHSLDGTDILFTPGADNYYTIEVYYTGSQTLYLYDLVMDSYSLLADGNQLSGVYCTAGG